MTLRDQWYYYDGQATRYCHLFNKSHKGKHFRKMVGFVRMAIDLEGRAFPHMTPNKSKKTLHYHAGA